MKALRIALVTAFLAPAGFAHSPLDPCAEQFIDGKVEHAPRVGGAAPGAPFATNRPLCYRDSERSFFAIEYWPEQFAPRWAAYRLDPDDFGPGACRTYTRAKANCYFRAESWREFVGCASADDPFHADHMLDGEKLVPSDFANTGHDRGHIAPRQAFSWHVCATYQTFTMANMSPQRAFLNQDIWSALERQVLTWAIDEGPLHVVTGTVFGEFPADKFAVYQDGVFDAAQIYRAGGALENIVEQHAENFAAFPAGHVLRPKRGAKPSDVKRKARAMRVPTGYFKTIYRPARDGEPAHAIGFLIPHSYENINLVPGASTEEAFWAFAARIDVIEEASDVRFPAIDDELKARWADPFFADRRTSREIRGRDCGDGAPAGVVPNTTRRQRIAQCTGALR